MGDPSLPNSASWTKCGPGETPPGLAGIGTGQSIYDSDAGCCHSGVAEKVSLNGKIRLYLAERRVRGGGHGEGR